MRSEFQQMCTGRARLFKCRHTRQRGNIWQEVQKRLSGRTHCLENYKNSWLRYLLVQTGVGWSTITTGPEVGSLAGLHQLRSEADCGKIWPTHEWRGGPVTCMRFELAGHGVPELQGGILTRYKFLQLLLGG